MILHYTGGLHIVDVSDPINPVFVACYGDDGYVHDAQCVTYKGPDARYYGAELCFCYNENTITIIDVTNKANIHLISRTSYPDFSYVHQGWLSTDQTHLVFDDEYDEITNPTKNKTTRTMMLNIVDLQQPTNFQEHFGTTATVDHNLYIRKATDPGQPASATAVSEEMASLYGTTDLIYQANYEAGLRILQSIDIENGFLEEIGYFDTVPQSNKPALNVSSIVQSSWCIVIMSCSCECVFAFCVLYYIYIYIYQTNLSIHPSMHAFLHSYQFVLGCMVGISIL